MPSADESSCGSHAEFSFDELVSAYFDCRRHKRNTRTAMEFEADLEHNLRALYDDLISGSYRIGQSICFVITKPKPREVWASCFRDRIAHHLLYNRISPRFYASFIADSCACIPGRGTLYAAKRLETKVRSITQNWSRPVYYLKCDLANFFVSIDRRILQSLLHAKIPEPWWRSLADQILLHDPRPDVDLRGHPSLLRLIPTHKSLFNAPAHQGLPIGNLSSQFFANVYLNVLDQFVKHQVGARHYVRYVDDFVILHEDPRWLNAARRQIEQVLHGRLAMRLNPRKTILQPVARGIDFVGQVILPWRRVTRRRTVRAALRSAATRPDADLRSTANSYLGTLRQASKSRSSRAKLARALLQRGRAIDAEMTRIFR